MGRREELVKELEGLPEELLEEVSDFAAFVRKRRESRGKRERSWGDFSLGTGAFDFWNNPEEVEYLLLTSQLRHEVKGWDEKIERTDNDFEGSGLKVPSLIKIGKLATVEEEGLEGILGKISSERLKRVLKTLKDHLDREGTDHG